MIGMVHSQACERVKGVSQKRTERAYPKKEMTRWSPLMQTFLQLSQSARSARACKVHETPRIWQLSISASNIQEPEESKACRKDAKVSDSKLNRINLEHCAR